MQYKVPQNVDIEDKVIAGLTLRQFMFIMIAGGACLVEYYLLSGPLGFFQVPTFIITAGIGITFAFVKINDRPFEIFIIAAAKSLLAPHIRVWQKDDDIDIPAHTETKHTRETIRPKKGVREIRSSLERLATVVDSGGVSELENMGDRITNVVLTRPADPMNLQDPLGKAEAGSPSVDQYMSQAKSYVDKNQKELTVGQISTLKTKKDDFEYEKLNLANENELENTLEEVEDKQKKFNKSLAEAKVEKFNRNN